MRDLKSLWYLPLSLNAGLQQVYSKCATYLFMFSISFSPTSYDTSIDVFPCAEVLVSCEVNTVELEVN